MGDEAGARCRCPAPYLGPRMGWPWCRALDSGWARDAPFSAAIRTDQDDEDAY